MRVLHILDHSIPLHSGYTFRTRSILLHQRQLGWETFHLTSPKQGAVSLLQETVDGLDFYRTPPLSSWLSKMPVVNQLAIIPILAKQIQQVAQEIKPDLIHAHSPALNGAAAWLAGKKLNIPVVYEVRAFWEDAAVDHGTSVEGGLRYKLTRSLETFVLKRVQGLTTICEGLKLEMAGRSQHLVPVTVIPNAVDTERFQPLLEKQQAILTKHQLQDKLVLGFIGSFYAYEGLDTLINAMPELVAAIPNSCLLLVGGGPEEAKLKAMAANSPVKDKIIMVERVPHSQVQDYYSVVDLFVYPRKSMRLTELVTPLKPLEAMAQHKLVVASDVGGHRELIQHGHNGLLFKKDDTSDLVAKIKAIQTNREQWQQILQNGRHYVETERTWERSVSHYQSVYQQALAQMAN
ncbi:glycosyltransferase, exosortase A system-associated [Endozoicomonas sp. SM1973]|uniref:Glycosyltransferase, exosortase A system-associated n=1 Tax=Spartinivicinus marinus TaxID=2994442 RepID=A0A853IET6_9GAMM|nr:TIGR04063 family PEP-CTERM/XrtA system glycosyltransferase [Spartinivicinus marinus]MCX4024983.1 glycosyltransferase, exosortase A system-associated [Spartinivicinus marinus]NYZ67675.1 glycosyltransferase, exosortase A system-associated [Spartinivicinus marinus]